MKTALVLACDDNFIAYASVFARRAVRLSAEKFPIVVVSDGVSDENKRLAQSCCPEISFIEASHLFRGSVFRTTSLYSRATYLRLYLDEILVEFDRAVYIDSDMTPLVDLSPLLHMVPQVSPVMATYSMGWPNQFVYDRLPLAREAGFLQGGLQIYDLKGVRQEHVFKDALRFAIDFPEKCDVVDQDAMNVALQGRWQVMDWRWNVMGFEARHCPKPFYIRHHGGPKKPWSADKSESESNINASWKKDLLESPWPQKYERTAFFKTYIRPVTRGFEESAKALIYGAYKEEKRYLQRLPYLLKQIEQFAREGRLATALVFQ